MGTSDVSTVTDATHQSDCCRAAPLCSTLYIDHGTTATGKTPCGTAGNKVPADLSCFTTNDANDACAGTVSGVDAKFSTTIDAAHCCRQMCSDGFELNGAGTSKEDCDAGDYQVST